MALNKFGILELLGALLERVYCLSVSHFVTR